MLYSDSKSKLSNIKATIKSMLDGDFPLSSGIRALDRLMKVFDDIELKLDRAAQAKAPDAVKLYSGVINTKIYQVLPILGFIIRSTNVRNSFELLEPFQVIADDVLQGLPQVLISAEWDYVPFAYPQNLEDLRSFVLIGMPASEVTNALLTPLAAHELGHAVWKNRSIGGAVNTTLQLRLENLYDSHMPDFRKYFPEYKKDDLHSKEILPEAIELSLNYANSQAEELFCDIFAYGLFGESYLQAFAYILAPGNGRGPSPKYPTYRTRVSIIGEIAKSEGVNLPSLSDLGLADEPHRGTPRDRFIIRMAEVSVDQIKSGLWTQVKEIFEKKKIVRPENGAVRSHLNEIRMRVPAHAARCLGDIVNAGWLHYRQLESSIDDHAIFLHKVKNLNELILKTIEVMEYRRRSQSGA